MEVQGFVQDKDVLKGTVVIDEKEYRATPETRKDAAMLAVGDNVTLTVTGSPENPEITALKVSPTYRQLFNGAAIGMAVNLAAARVENHETNLSVKEWAARVCDHAEALLQTMKQRQMA